MNLHRLDGCAPAPLAHYLKALGILRLVAEQADPAARGWWEGERFCLATTLDEEELLHFFLEDYRPAALVAPWNKGSGFFYENDPALGAIERSTAARFHPLREGIAASRVLLSDLGRADRQVREIKERPKQKGLSALARNRMREDPEYRRELAEADRVFKTLKAEFIPRLRLAWRGPHREWMDAVMVLDEQGAPRYPAILGTGGNDGRLDFTNNYFQKLDRLFDLSSLDGKSNTETGQWLRESLWRSTTHSLIWDSVGQFNPGATGGANCTTGPTGESLTNPMDFVLLLEGALLLAAQATKRLGSVESSRAAAPFAIRSHAAGYASASEPDEGARGEQWLPLWSRPATLAEIRQLFAEGRAQLGPRAVQEPLDLARAVSRLGVARGITAFQRFGYIERNGQSNLAVPLGRFHVPDHASPLIVCLDDIEQWNNRLRRSARDKGATAELRQVEHRLGDALLAVSQQPDEARRWHAVVSCLADAESVVLLGSHKCGAVPRLRPAWAQVGDDGSPEWRLAVSLATQAAGWSQGRGPHDPVRRHWVARKNEEQAAVMLGRRGVDDALALVHRRLIEPYRSELRHLPLIAAPGAGAHLADLAALTAGEVDVDRVLAWSRTLMALDGTRWAQDPPRLTRPDAVREPDLGWLAIRLALWPHALPDGRRIGADPAILRRLEAGDAAHAVELALRRLRAHGLRPALHAATVPPEKARLWGAALAFPIAQHIGHQLVRRLDPLAQSR